MKILVIFLLALLPFQAIGDQLPESLKRWKDQARYFWSLDFSNEDKFKETLVGYYNKVYSGSRLTLFEDWIRAGSLESEHYSAVYSGLGDTEVLEIRKTGSNSYKALAVQNSCYSLDYNPPKMNTIVRDLNIKNMAQSEIDNWLRGEGLAPRAEICLNIKSAVEFELDDKSLIHSEKWNRIESQIQLSGREHR